MSSILDALTQADHEARKRKAWEKLEGGRDPLDEAWESILLQAKDIVDTSLGPASTVLKFHRTLSAAGVMLLVVAGVVVSWDLWTRPPLINNPVPIQKALPLARPPAFQSWNGPLALRGAIAPGLIIEMHLVRKGTIVSGTYSYQRVGKDISLQGTITETGNVTLEESVSGRNTGIFTGKLVSPTRIEGTWSKPGSTRSRNFFLEKDSPGTS